MKKMALCALIITLIWFAGSCAGGSRGRAKTPDLWGYINAKGEMVIPPRFSEAGSFHEGLAAVKVCRRRLIAEICAWGYVDPSGSMKIFAEYDRASDFSEGFAGVMKCDGNDCKWGIIDKKGEWLKSPEYYNEPVFHEGLAAVTSDKSYIEDQNAHFKYIDYSGGVAIEGEFERARAISEGLASVYVDGKWSFINKKGEMEIETKFDEVGPFSEGYAYFRNTQPGVSVDQILSGYIDLSGNIREMPQVCVTGTFTDGLAPIAICENCVHKYNCEWGYVDKNLKTVIPTKFSRCRGFSGGLLLYEKKTDDGEMKYGYVDESGKDVVPPIFSNANNFSGEYAFACINNECGYINKTGEFEIKNTKIVAGGDFREGLAPVLVRAE